MAEELGVIQGIGLWAIERVLLMLRGWPASQACWPAPRYISVNVSPLQLLDASGVAPNPLVLEMTESCLMDNSDRNLASIHRLHALGLQLSIDDFGTGYSSLSSIKNFPFATLKIDRVFVRDVATDAASRQLVAAIIAIAAVYDLAIVTEGVEREAQARALCELQPRGTLCAQGFLYGRPAEVLASSGTAAAAIDANIRAQLRGQVVGCVVDNCCQSQQDCAMSRHTMSFALPESMREYIDSRVATGHYGNTSEYIRDLVRRDQEEQARQRLRELIQAGLASGPGQRRSKADETELLAIARGEID